MCGAIPPLPHASKWRDDLTVSTSDNFTFMVLEVSYLPLERSQLKPVRKQIHSINNFTTFLSTIKFSIIFLSLTRQTSEKQ